MYKRYLQPSAAVKSTKYTIKKLKLDENFKLTSSNTAINSNETFYDVIDEDEEMLTSSGENSQEKNVDNVDADEEYFYEAETDEYINENVDDCAEDPDLEDDGFEKFINDRFVHPKLNCKVADAVIIILEFFLRHHLTWVALDNLLVLLHKILGDESCLPKTKYFFKKILGGKQNAVFHFYCQNCGLYIDTFENLKPVIDLQKQGKQAGKKCSNCQHPFTLDKMNNGHFFIQLPIREQLLKKILKNPQILNVDISSDTDNIRDVYDGKLYKSLRKKVGNGNLVTLTVNTDGVKVFKSKAKASLWPIQMIINETSTSDRFKKENIILSGVWFGPSPDFDIFFKPFSDELNGLDEDKIQVTVNNSIFEIIVRVLLFTTDTIARCKVLMFKQFNGSFGCTYCLHPGVKLNDSKTCKYPVGDYCRRTHLNSLKLMKLAFKYGKEICGVKGASPLIALKDYDIIRETVIDYMHCVLEGVVSLLLDLWFDSENHFEKYYVTPRMEDIVNKNLECIKALRSFTRRPRSTTEKAFWKANEFRCWLLYFALPCLKGVLKDPYFRHFALLSEAIFIFLQTNISKNDFDKASRNLEEFVENFEKLYGEENMMYNVHLLEHLAECVEDCGPLWAYSNFNFESNNNWLVQNVKGTTDVEKQLATRYFYYDVLEDLKDEFEYARDYIEEIRSGRVKNSEKIGSITLLGKCQKTSDLDFDEQLVLQKKQILEFKKFFFSNDVFYSTAYRASSDRTLQTNDTVVILKNGTIGQITRIYVHDDVVYILLKTFRVEAVPHFPRHIKKVFASGNLQSQRADTISEKLVFISTSKESYVSHLPNRFESD